MTVAGPGKYLQSDRFLNVEMFFIQHVTDIKRLKSVIY